MSATAVPARFTTLPDEHALQATAAALEEHGFSVEVPGDLDAARQAVLARIPAGPPVMTGISVTLEPQDRQLAPASLDEKVCAGVRLPSGWRTLSQSLRGSPSVASMVGE